MSGPSVDGGLLAFRYPAKVPGCACPICLRTGDTSTTDQYPSPFALYRLIKWDAVQGVEREPTDEERQEFNRLYPSMAYSRTAGEGGKMETPWVKLCLKLIRRLRKEKTAGAFNAPVDPVALNIPDYLKIILHPMDLGTIENKLLATESKLPNSDVGAADALTGDLSDASAPSVARSEVYASPDEFASDVRMVWRNTFLYNQPALAIYQWARELSIKFEQQYAQL